jgi:SAM-dependent methyltransferase
MNIPTLPGIDSNSMELWSKITHNAYERIAQIWAWERFPNYWKNEIDTFLSEIPSWGNILDIWCWSWRDSVHFIQNWYTYTGFDTSRAMLEIARKTSPTWNFIEWDIYDLSFLQWEIYDGFWACGILLHVPRTDVYQILESIKSLLTHKWVWFISIQEWEGDEIREDILPTGEKYSRYFCYYTRGEFTEILESCWFDVKKINYNMNEPDRKHKWLTFFVEKR